MKKKTANAALERNIKIKNLIAIFIIDKEG